jgi:hypothetical protein
MYLDISYSANTYSQFDHGVKDKSEVLIDREGIGHVGALKRLQSAQGNDELLGSIDKDCLGQDFGVNIGDHCFCHWSWMVLIYRDDRDFLRGNWDDGNSDNRNFYNHSRIDDWFHDFFFYWGTQRLLMKYVS